MRICLRSARRGVDSGQFREGGSCLRIGLATLCFTVVVIVRGQAQGAPPLATRVPEIRGRSVEEARQCLRLRWLDGVGGKFFLHPRDWRRDLTAGYVYMQTPQPGTPSRSGARVGYWRFFPAPEEAEIVTVPLLLGKPGNDALQEIRVLKLDFMYAKTPTPPEDYSGSDETFTVVDQYPRDGQPVYEGTTILLHVYYPEKD